MSSRQGLSITPVIISLFLASDVVDFRPILPYPGHSLISGFADCATPTRSFSDLPIHVAYGKEFDNLTESLHRYAGLHVPFGRMTYMDGLGISVAATSPESPPPSGYSSVPALS